MVLPSDGGVKCFSGLVLNLPEEEVPAITNGVHAQARLSNDSEPYDRYLGPNWSSASAENQMWESG